MSWVGGIYEDMLLKGKGGPERSGKITYHNATLHYTTLYYIVPPPKRPAD